MSESGFSVDDQGRFCYRPPEFPALLLISAREENGYSFQIWRAGEMLLPMHFKERPWLGDMTHLGQLARTVTRFSQQIGFPADMNSREAQDLAFRIISRFTTEIIQWENAHKEATQVLATPGDTDEALKLLEDPEMLCKIHQAVGDLGLVGESKNGLLTYLIQVSSLLAEPNNQRGSGRAGLGKTAIVVHVSKLWPPEKLLVRSGVTKKWMWYLSEAKEVDAVTRKLDLRGKVLIILEESESTEFLEEAKPLLSHDVSTLTYSFVDEKVTKQMVLEGWPAYIGVSVVEMQGEEHQRRVLHATPDRGQKKYAAVIRSDAERHSTPWMVKQVKLAVFHQAVRQLKPTKVWIPWLDEVAKSFPANKAAFMTHWKQLRILIESVTFLHQYQRNHVEIGGEEYVQAEPIDLQIALAVAENALSETLQSVSRDVKDFFEYVAEKGGTATHTYKDLLRHYEDCFGEPVSKTTIRDRYVEPLVELGLFDKDESKKTHEFSIVIGKQLAHPANWKNILEKVCSDEIKAKIDRYYAAKAEGKAGDPSIFSVSEKIVKESLTLSRVSALEKLLARTKDEEYPEKDLRIAFAGCASAEAEKKPETRLPPFEEKLSMLRMKYPQGGTLSELAEFLEKNGQSEAESFISRLVGDKLFMDADGVYRWV